MFRDFERPGRSPVLARNAAVATSHPLATSAALEVLYEGGNAVDAAIAACAVQAVVEPHMNGIGGDCFAIVMEPDGRMTGFNGSGAAPAAASPKRLADLGVVDQIPPVSPHSVTVPGAVRAWETILKAHGTRGLDALLTRAIDYAANGFPVAPRVARDWACNVGKLARLPASAADYLIDGAAPKAGTILKYPRLADSLAAIASGGAEAFYSGPIAEDIVSAVRDLGGLLDLEDLGACHTSIVAPIMRGYRGHTIAELPPNGQGVIALVILGILERFDLESLDPLGADRFHLQMEAARLAYAVRDRFVTDPAFMEIGAADLISEATIDQLLPMITAGRRSKDFPVIGLAPQTDTVYLSVVDKDGLSVSLINSIFSEFGSGIVAPKSGVLLHNRGSVFTARPGQAQSIAGGKYPLHTIIPAMGLKSGHPWLCFGVMGGHYQACGHAHLLTNIIDYGMDVQAAIDCPRMFFDLQTGALDAEAALPENTVEGLRQYGHDVRAAASPIGGSQAIRIDRSRKLLIAGSDPRKDGHAAGY
ncbi:gamma-glutamyltransferase family protein [Roseibium sp. RKSG952]|uniref:gamma-glutamyltransferase family protein n=1 Tax=Roseibium sp. RKSG952 TaxID=2529384 RepID=UPI0012BD538E|nr:gamma-glutamyltransferase family protein [Roseibium sp. RKSG952]MTH96274.1 gamma-glutamyltransferase family protein [Roseibium sp. RKSG952]